ncbi:MAG: hypothetical protein KAH57_03935 [Thermoplasmata archaeon]|nr:hypothetical protein [Thermoplasmata archaeon]
MRYGVRYKTAATFLLILLLLGAMGPIVIDLYEEEPPSMEFIREYDLPELENLNSSIVDSVSLAGDYLLNHLDDQGKFDYLYNASSGRSMGGYNVLRHAGTSYSLALIFKYTGEERFFNGTITSINYMLYKHLHFEGMGPSRFAYIGSEGRIKLGGAALALLALVETQKICPGVDLMDEIHGLADFILKMQYENGSFRCYFREEDRHNDYYPGEALLALAKVHDLTGEGRYLTSLERGLDFYVDHYSRGRYSAFTPWGTEAMVYAHEHLGNSSYVDLCFRMANRCMAGQIGPWEGVDPSVVGAFSYDPRANTASRAEGVVDSYLLALIMEDNASIERYGKSADSSAGFLMYLQLNETDVFGFEDPALTVGGFPASYDDLNIRIDYVQHAVVVLVKVMVYRAVQAHI